MTTILLVEDNKNQRLLYEQELRLENYEVIKAIDGKDALKKNTGAITGYDHNGHMYAKDGWP